MNGMNRCMAGRIGGWMDAMHAWMQKWVDMGMDGCDA